MRSRKLAGSVVAALAAAGLVTAPAGAAAIGTDCSVTVHGENADSLGRMTARVRPGAERPFGEGTIVIALPDGGHVMAFAETLLCRRDGGSVPAHGGANIADATGPAMLRPAGGGPPVDVFLQVHVEDRGDSPFDDDYAQWRIADPIDGSELASGGNYLASGDVVLTPVRR